MAINQPVQLINYSTNQPPHRGFTLIELLVVVFIIGLLSSGITLFLLDAKKQARDTKRKADLQTIATALEMYYNQNKVYPWGAAVGDSGTVISDWSQWKDGTAALAVGLAPYLSPLPRDPININKTGSYGGVFLYIYRVRITNLLGYVLAANLEKPDSNDPNFSAAGWPTTGRYYNYFLRGGDCLSDTQQCYQIL